MFPTLTRPFKNPLSHSKPLSTALTSPWTRLPSSTIGLTICNRLKWSAWPSQLAVSISFFHSKQQKHLCTFVIIKDHCAPSKVCRWLSFHLQLSRVRNSVRRNSASTCCARHAWVVGLTVRSKVKRLTGLFAGTQLNHVETHHVFQLFPASPSHFLLASWGQDPLIPGKKLHKSLGLWRTNLKGWFKKKHWKLGEISQNDATNFMSRVVPTRTSSVSISHGLQACLAA